VLRFSIALLGLVLAAVVSIWFLRSAQSEAFGFALLEFRLGLMAGGVPDHACVPNGALTAIIFPCRKRISSDDNARMATVCPSSKSCNRTFTPFSN
jgi:hypothetical protein